MMCVCGSHHIDIHAALERVTYNERVSRLHDLPHPHYNPTPCGSVVMNATSYEPPVSASNWNCTGPSPDITSFLVVVRFSTHVVTPLVAAHNLSIAMWCAVVGCDAMGCGVIMHCIH